MSVTQAESTAQPGSPSAIDSEVSAEQRAARERAKAQQRKWMAANIAIRIVSLIVPQRLGIRGPPDQPCALHLSHRRGRRGSENDRQRRAMEVSFAKSHRVVRRPRSGDRSRHRAGAHHGAFLGDRCRPGSYITALYSIPSVALVPVLVLWFGIETSAKIAVVFLFTFFPIVINTQQGVGNVDGRLTRGGPRFPLQRATTLGPHCPAGGGAVHRDGSTARHRPRLDRHGARGSSHGDHRHRLSDLALCQHLPNRRDVRAHRDVGFSTGH